MTAIGAKPAAVTEDRRRHRRVALALPGRYMLEDGAEYECECMDVSPGGVRISASKAGPWGSRVVVYIEGVGRMEGHLIRRAPGWFAVEIQATSRKEVRVEERIAWIADNVVANTDERRRLSRKYVERQAVRLVAADGRIHIAAITDVSREGAALLTEASFEVGAAVRLDGRRARVARCFPGGIAIAFETASAALAARRAAAPVARRA